MKFAQDRWIHPGESVMADITLISGAEFLDKLPASQQFEITEGKRVIGRGVVIGSAVETESSEVDSLART